MPHKACHNTFHSVSAVASPAPVSRSLAASRLKQKHWAETRFLRIGDAFRGWSRAELRKDVGPEGTRLA